MSIEENADLSAKPPQCTSAACQGICHRCPGHNDSRGAANPGSDVAKKSHQALSHWKGLCFNSPSYIYHEMQCLTSVTYKKDAFKILEGLWQRRRNNEESTCSNVLTALKVNRNRGLLVVHPVQQKRCKDPLPQRLYGTNTQNLLKH